MKAITVAGEDHALVFQGFPDSVHIVWNGRSPSRLKVPDSRKRYLGRFR